MTKRVAAMAMTLGVIAHAGFSRGWAQTTPDARANVSQLPAGYSRVAIPVSGRHAATIDGYLLRPAREGPQPAIVALHGCGGVLSKSGRLVSRSRDWAERWAGQGYVVLLPDSFNPRGFREICSLRAGNRPIHPRDRVLDAEAAIDWLAGQPFVDAKRLALVGWSNGASTALWAAGSTKRLGTAQLRQVVAFYPGCQQPSERSDWKPAVPLTVLIGTADNWTAPEPCRRLVARHPSVRLIEYEGAVHGFDAPGSPRRTRKGVGISAAGGGAVEVGTDPAARAAAIDEVTRLFSQVFSARN